ncbi:MAG TPA: ATP-binding protein [Gemmatimonadaceae bacterium]|nr:ATP-binding protein [Gemmatimonadaceae bacterium]
MSRPPGESRGAVPGAGPAASHRELIVVREIAHAFLTAEHPEDVFQFALERVSPLLGASFACVYVVDGASELMRLAAAYNWPERYRPWLGEVRVRLGFGPSGDAARERHVVEVADLFADPELEDWQEVAAELGFAAIVALPLETRNGVLGALTFYYADAGSFTDEQRALQRLVADQLAATAEKAGLIDELRRANAALLDANAELERQYAAVLEARRVKDEFLTNISHELRTPLTAVIGYVSLLQDGISGPLTADQAGNLQQVHHASERLLELIENLLELTTLKRGGLEVVVEDFDPRTPLRDAVSAIPSPRADVTLVVEEPTTLLPAMTSDRKKVTKILLALLHNAFKFTPHGEVRCSLEVANGRAVYRVQDTGIGIPRDAQAMVFDEFRQVDGSATRRYGGSGLGLALSRRLARLLGGDIELVSEPGAGSLFTLELPLDYEPAAVRPPDDADAAVTAPPAHTPTTS